MSQLEQVRSWGRVGAHEHMVVAPRFLDEAEAALAAAGDPVLPFGAGRSYGDVCLNSGGSLLRTRYLDRFISVDWQTGIVRAEAGMTLDTLLSASVRRGWFLPVSPGTKFCTLGGAVANDVHGKNHETAGTIGCHVLRLGLARSTGEVLELSPEQNGAMFAATIGGLGLTGLILWVEIAMRRIMSARIKTETLDQPNLDAFFRLAEESRDWEYTVSWVDCLASGPDIGRGLFMRGRHEEDGTLTPHRPPRVSIPADAPAGLLRGPLLRGFNWFYRARPWARGRRVVHYDSFLYPLDAISAWNRLYGKAGFFQHQCVVPIKTAREFIRELLRLTAEFGEGSFLVVLKLFGNRASPGLLSFPRAGATLAIDFPNRGASTQRLLARMGEVVTTVGGRMYPAKDASMSPEAFRASYPDWVKLEEIRDPKIMSDFWRRMTQ